MRAIYITVALTYCIFALFVFEGRAREDCWWSGCQPKTWIERRCSKGYYQNDTKPCDNGDMYRCCPNSARPQENRADESGICGWYGADGEVPPGRPTASGERFDRNAMKAAHKTLPFGTKIRVTNTDNGRYVDVTINDRGPWAPNRILDLTYGAFGVFENRDKGITPCSYVRI